jgi:hypothetical protein
VMNAAGDVKAVSQRFDHVSSLHALPNSARGRNRPFVLEI